MKMKYMNINKVLIFATLFTLSTINATQNAQLFNAIQESDMATVLDAINNGADINAPSEMGYKYTPLMFALETLHNRIVNTHNTKRTILWGSVIAGIIAGPLVYDQTQKYTADKTFSKNIKIALNTASGLSTFGGMAYLSNRLLNRIFTHSSDKLIAHAYLIVQILLEQPEININAVNEITGQTAHQMVGNFIIQVPSLISHSHPCSTWHVINTSDSVLKKLLAIAIVLGIDISVQKLDYSILKEKIDTVFMPIAQHIAKRHSVK